MYDDIKYLGKTLKQWREEVFHNTFTTGELYRMMKDGVDFTHSMSKYAKWKSSSNFYKEYGGHVYAYQEPLSSLMH